MDLGLILDEIPEPSMGNALVDFLNGAVPNTSGNYCLPVPMTNYQRLLYDQVVSAHYSDLLQFFETDEPVMEESLQTLYFNSQLVTTHPYLLVDHYLPHNLLLKEVPERLASSSGKFRVLHDIIEIIRNSKVNIALISRAGKTIDLLEAFMMGKLVNYRRYSGSYLRDRPAEDAEFSTIHLIPSDEFDPKHIAEDTRFDVVLAFDLSFEMSKPHIDKIRRQSVSQGILVPIVNLVAYYSVEHIRYSLSGSASVTNRVDYLKKVLAAIPVLRGKVGFIPNDLKPLYAHNLKYLSRWFHQPSVPWPLPDPPAISEYTALDVEKSLLTEVGEDIDRDSKKEDKQKKISKDIYQVKRFKREHDVPIPLDQVFVMSDNRNVDSSDNNPHGNSTILTHKIVQKLDYILQDNNLKSRELENYRETASSRQAKLEEVFEELGINVSRNKELEHQVKSAENRAARLLTDNTNKKDKNDQLTKELEQAREQLRNGPPEIAEFEKQRAKISELEISVKKLEKSLESTKTQNDYLTQEYQKASQSAAESFQTIQTLEAEKLELKKKADGEAARLRLLTFDEERLMKDDKIKELQLKLQLLEEQLVRVIESDKLQPIGRSRYARGTSRTKSPQISRIGSPNVDSR